MEDLEITDNFKNGDLVVCDPSAFNEASEYTESIHKLDIKKLDTVVKIENLEITESFKIENLVCGTGAFNETSECTDSTKPKYFLKLEKDDMQYELFNTCDNYNINYNLSAAEENSGSTHSSIAQNYLLEVFESKTKYSKNLNKTNAYCQCYRCGHKAESKLKLIFHLKHHTRKSICHEDIIFRRLSRYKNLICCYRCFLCNYLTKHKYLFDFHIRIHLIKKNYKHIFKLTNVHTKAFRTAIKVNKRKCIKNYKNYYKHSVKNRSKSEKSKQHLSHCNSLKPHIVEKRFSCSICEYKFNFKVNLKHHMLIHTGEKPFSCSICEYQFRRKSSLNQHMLIHTGEKPFSCSVCTYQCSRKSTLNQHMLIHTGEKPYSCSVCEYQGNQRSSLKQHVQIHTGKKPFSCSVCEYQCSQKSTLKEHMRVHTGEKPFSCCICDYQCSRKRSLKKHMLIHTGDKPFSCYVCEYKCSQKSTLKQHMIIHTGEKPFSCSVCEYQCSRQSNLKRHMQIHT